MRKLDTDLLEAPCSNGRRTASVEPIYSLTVACVYENATNQEWVRQLCDRVPRALGQEALCPREWVIQELAQTRAFADAVLAAATAEVIVVSMQATLEIPADLRLWVNAWLLRRRRPSGALIACLGITEEPGWQTDFTANYLRAAAQLASLDFILERHGPSGSSTLPKRRTTKVQ